MSKKEIQKVEPTQMTFSPENLLAQAISNNVPVDTMEKLLGMRRELKAEWAKEQFDQAMAEFQGECPVIEKKKAGGKTKSGVVAYMYAPLEDIDAQTKALRMKYGFSHLFKTEAVDKVKVTCIVKHSSGHSEDTTVEMPLATKTDIMSSPQQVAATITFAKRYAFVNAFGISTKGEDIDAQKTTVTASKFDKAIGMIRAMEKNGKEKLYIEQLEDYKAKVEVSGYSATEKKALQAAIVEKITELNA